MRIMTVFGTRPEAIKLIPIILALRASERFRPIVVTTGYAVVDTGETLAAFRAPPQRLEILALRPGLVH